MRVRSQPVQYGRPTNLVIPQKPTWLGLIAQIDPNGGQIKPRVVWQEDPAFPARKEQIVILFRGDAEIEYPNHKNFEFLFVTHDQNRRGGGIASLWACDPVQIPVTPMEAPSIPKRPPTQPSPESLAAIRDHEKKLQLQAEQAKALMESIEALDPDEVEAELEGSTIVATIPDDQEENLLDAIGIALEDGSEDILGVAKSKKKVKAKS